MTDIDPETAAAAMTADGDLQDGDLQAESEPVEQNGEEEGITFGPETSTESEGLVSKLWNSDPSPDLERVQSPWQPEEGGLTRIYRGVQKIGDIEGLPAILDIAIGIAEEAAKRQETDPQTDPEDRQTDDQEQATQTQMEGLRQ